jgi:hypothetical protein
MAKVKHIEIKGLDELIKGLENVPKEVTPSVIRNIARKPANKVVSAARKLFPYKDTGRTKRSFGILRVVDRMQKFVEVGVKGRSLAWIFMLGASDREKASGARTGDIKPIGNILEDAAGQSTEVTAEISVDLTRVIEKAIKRYAR